MKKLITSILVLVLGFNAKPQGDCYQSAQAISTCGYFFAGNNANFTDDCPGDKCGCVGGSSNPSNLDDNCATTYSGGNCGSDFLGSIENSMFWFFTPTESCEYQLCITPENCCCNQGAGLAYMQVWIGQRDPVTLDITQYYVNDNNNTSITSGNTICYNFNVSDSDGDLIIMVDGNAGTECDINLDINQVSCSDTCPIIVVDPFLKWEKDLIQYKNTVPENSPEDSLIATYNILGESVDKNNLKKNNIYFFLYNKAGVKRVIYTENPSNE